MATFISANTNSAFSINALPTFQLILTVDSDTNFTLSPYFSANFSASIQADGAATISNGFSVFADLAFVIGVDAAAGFKLTFSNSAKVVSASLIIPGSLSALALLNLNFGLLQWDANANAYAYLAPSSNTAFTITVPIINSGIILAVQYSTQSPIKFPTLFSQMRVISSAPSSYSFPNGIFIDVSVAIANSFNVTFFAKNPKPNSANGHSDFGKFISINLLTDNTVSANVSFSYDSTQNPNQLSIAFYDDATATWTFPTTGLSVDTNAKIITQATTHFSTWSLYASSASTQVTVTWAVILLALAVLLL